MTKKSILEKLKFRSKEIKKFGVRQIGVFGSFANGRQKKTSDIDIAVEFANGRKTFDNYMDLKYFLESIFNKKVDLVIKKAIKPELKERIEKSISYV